MIHDALKPPPFFFKFFQDDSPSRRQKLHARFVTDRGFLATMSYQEFRIHA